jgi:DUF438 domain-containing protein
MDSAITPKTTIGTLLGEHPFLLGYLVKYHPEFKKLMSPIARHTIGRFATLERAAEIAGIPPEVFVADIAAKISAETGTAPPVPAAGEADSARQEELKAIIRELHAGCTPEEVQSRFKALIQDVDATEVARMEQALIKEGLAEEEVKRLCDVHMKVFQESLEKAPTPSAPPGHPVDTFLRENRAVLEVTQALRESAARLGTTAEPSAWNREKPAMAKGAERLREYERHYVRKENQLFPFLETHGLEGPTKVMWALDDDIRAAIKELRQAVTHDDALTACYFALEAATMVDDMVNKEEKVLFPMALDVLSEEEWRMIRAGEEEIGYTLLSEVPTWGAGQEPAEPARTGQAEGLIPLHTGTLSREQLDLMLRALPVDLTFVDENDQVQFYSEGKRVFPRSPGVIGRRVQNCHPPASVHIVQEIIEAFRTGERDVAEFWIETDGRLVHIRYFALRDEDGSYRGVVEMTQDVSGIRSLHGQRRLLDW